MIKEARKQAKIHNEIMELEVQIELYEMIIEDYQHLPNYCKSLDWQISEWKKKIEILKLKL